MSNLSHFYKMVSKDKTLTALQLIVAFILWGLGLKPIVAWYQFGEVYPSCPSVRVLAG